MKSNKIICIFLCFFTTSIFAFEGYGYSPMEDSSDYYGSDNTGDDDNNYNNTYSDSNYARQEQSDSYNPQFKKYSKPRKEFVGSGKAFVFDPKELRWFAYYNGSLINSGRASGGRYYCPDIGKPCKTPVGVFQVSRKGGIDCKSSKYPIGKGNAPMPYCMFFKGGFAIHGSWALPNYNASHGCIRVHPEDARWLNQAFMSSGTRVIVKSY